MSKFVDQIIDAHNGDAPEPPRPPADELDTIETAVQIAMQDFDDIAAAAIANARSHAEPIANARAYLAEYYPQTQPEPAAPQLWLFAAIRDGEIEASSVHPTEAAATRAAIAYANNEAPECGGFDDLAQAIDTLQGAPALYVERTTQR